MSLRATAAFGTITTIHNVALARFDDPIITWDGPYSFFDSTTGAAPTTTGLPAVVDADVRLN